MSKEGLKLEEAVEEALCFGWIDGKMKSVDEEKFILRFSPRKIQSIWSEINKNRAIKLIELGKMTPEGLAKIEEAKASGQWDSPVPSKKAYPLPLDLEKELKANTSAYTNFLASPNSNQTQYIYWVMSAKRNETRARRIKIVVENSMKKIRATDYSMQKKKA